MTTPPTTTKEENRQEWALPGSRHNRGESFWFDVKHVLMSTRFGHTAQKYLQKDPGLVTRDYFDGSFALSTDSVKWTSSAIVSDGV